MKPAAGELFLSRMRVLQITLHDQVAAEHDFAHRLTVPGHGLHGCRVHYRHILLHRRTHALAAIECGTSVQGQIVPAFLLRAYGGGTVGLGQPVDVRNVKTDPLHPLDHRGRRRSASDTTRDAVLDTTTHFFRSVDKHAVHDRRSTEMSHFVQPDCIENRLCIYTTQAHIG